jgi:signal transduction histidine kinase
MKSDMNIYTLLLLLFPFAVQAQVSAKRDSLLRIAAGASSDTARVWALMNAGKLYSVQQPDTALYYLDQAATLAQKIGFQPGIAKCQINRSVPLDKLGRFSECVTACETAIPICERLGMKREMVAAYNNLGNAWDYLGNRWKAIDAFSNALKAMEGVNLPPHFPLTVRNNLARQYNDLHLFDKAIEYGNIALKEATALGDSIEVAAALQILAFAAIHTNREAEALEHCRRIMRLTKDQEPSLYVFGLHNTAMLLSKNNLAEAKQLAQEALELSKQTGNKNGEANALFLLSRLSLYSKQYAAAKTYALAALNIAQSSGISDEMARIYLTLSDLALTEGDIAAYRNYREIQENMLDTLAGRQLVLATQELETRYETEKKEQQIATLERERELQKLRLQRKNSLIGGLIGVSMLLLLAAFLAVRNLQQRRRLAEQEINIQQQQIIQLKQEQQLNVADAILRGQEDERSRLARDLHDGLGGMLSGVKQSLNSMTGHQILSETAAAALGQVIHDLDQSIGELRHIARNMMPEALVRFGLKDALRDYCDHLRLNSALDVHYQAYGLDNRLPQQTEVILFRIVQELLNNIVKHADATQVLVQLMETDGRISLAVEDNGKGFNPEQLKKAPGVGWLNIQSRVDYLGGTLDLKSAPGKGVSVSIECPRGD